jgi:DNA-binding NarL/FixJ family response regulator
MNDLPRASIFIVDDHELIRRGLRELVNGATDMQVCGEAGTAAEAMRLIPRCSPDVTVLDLTLPDGNGIELIKRLCAHDPDMRILVASMHDEEVFAERALLAGAMGYINKQETAERILDGMRRILKGKVFLSPRMTERLLRDFAGHPPAVGHSPVERLSDRELEVFELIGHGMRTTEIAESLNLSVKTIETYRAHIKQKLKLESSAALTRSAVQWSLEAR